MSTLRLALGALAIACTASIASAQTTNPPADATTEVAKPMPAAPAAEAPKPAPAAPMDQAANETEKPPLPGANSFTEGQARERIAKAGFEDVQGLKKDDQGIWRGQAKKSGQQVGVALDYRGNIVQQ